MSDLDEFANVYHSINNDINLKIPEAMKRIASLIRSADRIGENIDDPEGVRYIQLSHTLANQISDELENLADEFNKSINNIEFTECYHGGETTHKCDSVYEAVKWAISLLEGDVAIPVRIKVNDEILWDYSINGDEGLYKFLVEFDEKHKISEN